MDRKQNLIRTVKFENPEYIPMVFHINYSCWNYYDHNELSDLMESHEFLFPDFVRDDFTLPEPPEFAKKDKLFTDPWGCVWKTSEDGILGVVIEHPIADWSALKNYTPPSPDSYTHWGAVDWDDLAKNENPCGFITSLKAGEVGHGHTFLKLCDLRGYENLIMDMHSGDKKLWGLIDIVEQFNLGLTKNFIDKVNVEWLGFAEDLGMQFGPMLKPEHFRKYIKPSYQKMMNLARDAGCIIHMHSDGDIKTLIDDIIDGGVEAINLQDLVNGIDWIKTNLKGKVCIDLDIDRQQITPNGTPEDCESLILNEIKELGSKSGGLMMIYGLYPGVPIENAAAIMDAMEKYAFYFSK